MTRHITIHGPHGGQVRLESTEWGFLAWDDTTPGAYHFEVPVTMTRANCFLERRGQRGVGVDGYAWYAVRLCALGDFEAVLENTCPVDPINDWCLFPVFISAPVFWLPPLRVVRPQSPAPVPFALRANATSPVPEPWPITVPTARVPASVRSV